MIGVTINDRYKITGELGKGGMGTVFKATDNTLERDVAVKIMSNTKLGTEGRSRLLREAQLTAKLSHPNIVTVFDAGEYDEAPFIVMEIVEGKTLYENKPESLEEIIEVAKQICMALEHAHTHEIVHRDLKPENVAFTSDGSIKLMDFGLARSTASRLTSEGGITGTVFYMPPEQAMGQDVDGRADLYSFGVMLYEMVTGERPFKDDNPMAILSQHINAPVVPPKAKREDLPVLLNKLIVQLLDKDPDDRPASAKQVLETLNLPDLLKEQETEEIPLLDRIARGRMVGRKEDYNTARQLWVQAAKGEGQTLLISGEPGIGKTRLMREVFTQAEVSGGQAYMGESYVESNTPYGAFSQIVRSALTHNDNNGLELPDTILDDLLKLTPDLKHEYPNTEPNPPLDPEAEQNRLIEHFISFCQIISEKQPLLLVVDDIHWSDSGTLAIFRTLSRRTRSLPVMLLGTYREVELTEARAFNEMLLELNRQRIGERIKLNRLTEEQTGRMLSAIFQDEVSEEFREGIHRETDGNPFFIEEVCRALIDSGKLVIKDGRWDRPSMEELEIPQGIQVAVESRLSILDEEAQDVVRMAAVLGREFEFDILQTALEVNEDTLIDHLETAEDAQMIQEVDGHGDVTFAFVHALVPQSIRESIRTLRRRKLHKQAVAAFETQQPENYEALAFHALHGGEDEKALRYYSLAGERALNTFANHDAIQFLLNALDLVEEKADEAALLKNLGEAENRVGNLDEAFETWRKAITINLEIGEQDNAAELYHLVRRNRWFAEDAQASLEICLEGMEILKGSPEGPGMAAFLAATATAHMFTQKDKEAILYGTQALEMAEKFGAVDVQSDVLNTLAICRTRDPKTFNIDEAIEMMHRAIQIAEDNQLWQEAARGHNNINSIQIPFKGKVKEAIFHTSRTIEMAQQSGAIANELFYSYMKMTQLAALGQSKEIYSLLERRNYLTEQLVDQETAVDFQKHIDAGFKAMYLGSLEQGIEIGEKILASTEDPQNRSYWFNQLTPIYFLLENYAQAEKHAHEMIEIGNTGAAYGKVVGPIDLATIFAYQGKFEKAHEQLKTGEEEHQKYQRFVDHTRLLLAKGQIYALEEHWDDAWAAFQELADSYKEKEHLKPLADTYFIWGKMQLRGGEEEDKARAKELLGQALDLFQQMEAEGWIKRVEQILAEID